MKNYTITYINSVTVEADSKEAALDAAKNGAGVPIESDVKVVRTYAERKPKAAKVEAVPTDDDAS